MAAIGEIEKLALAIETGDLLGLFSAIQCNTNSDNTFTAQDGNDKILKSAVKDAACQKTKSGHHKRYLSKKDRAKLNELKSSDKGERAKFKNELKDSDKKEKAKLNEMKDLEKEERVKLNEMKLKDSGKGEKAKLNEMKDSDKGEKALSGEQQEMEEKADSCKADNTEEQEEVPEEVVQNTTDVVPTSENLRAEEMTTVLDSDDSVGTGDRNSVYGDSGDRNSVYGDCSVPAGMVKHYVTVINARQTFHPIKDAENPVVAVETGEIMHFRINHLSELESKSMAGVMDRFKKKKAGQMPEWSRNGSFLNKPEVGWIHPDQQLCPDAGICYGVRYIGNVEVKESMKSLDFDTRTQIAREAINRVAEAAGLKTATKKRKVDKRVTRMLGENPIMQYAGANVNLTITTDRINLMVMETGEIIADHPMHVVSFASGGDAETLDFVSYVAKDPALGRACHVLECGGGLAEDVVTTVGQAFELRFKQYLQKQPKALQLPDRRENPAFESERWGEAEEYYNDRPGACPPSPGPEVALPPVPPVSEYNSPSNIPVGTYMTVDDNEVDVYAEVKHETHNLIDFSDTTDGQTYDNSQGKKQTQGVCEANVYDNRKTGINGESNVYDDRRNLVNKHSTTADVNDADSFSFNSLVNELKDRQRDCELGAETAQDAALGATGGVGNGDAASSEVDLRENPSTSRARPAAPVFEEWYHKKISRKEAEKLLELDGDFLVRESSNNPHQFVLSGRQNSNVRHLLLVDPEGIVRTKDFIFDSVSHLINYHRQNGLPIITQGSELRLVRPIKICLSDI